MVEEDNDLRSVLLVSHAFPPDVGGAQNVAVQNARALSCEYDVEVLTGTPAPDQWDQKYDFQVTRLSTPFGVWPIHYARAFTSRAGRDYEAVIFNDPAAIYAAGLSAPTSHLRRSIAYLHGSEPEFFFLNSKLLYRLVWYRYFLEKGLDGCRVIAPVSKYMKWKFVQKTGLTRLQSKMEVAYAGVDRSVFYPDPIDVRETLDIKEECDILLSASRIVEKKGYLDMLSVFEEARRAGQPLHWIIAGDGPYLSTLVHKVEEQGLSDVVSFVGELTQDELRSYYSSVDVFWLLSRFREAFGLVYIEANACGTPVIGRNRGGVKEAIQNGQTGFLVDKLEESEEILVSGAYRKLNRSDAIAHAEKFNLDSTARQLKQIISGL
jgi:glycosyltransferase involved in cell wall biosynthesis